MMPKTQISLARLSVMAISLLGVSGCSNFETQWREARHSDTSSLAGRWTGTWQSEVSGHHDTLRCLINPASEARYLARFEARYRKLIRFTFRYAVPLDVVQTGGTNRFQGEANLGWLKGGQYRYSGSATSNDFTCSYRCQYDHGTFHLWRPE